ncbi:hypothetical protein GWK47_028115 [Chionoecetes opilio]|uniref:Uncharacterized protein n=1 Tax=Chionoecetes opilio TaxID=41210 RepID=A0A8J4YM94_CHIOP|nr:hypothetical protein GWK47_028115 [Chionoecetes opilio]
MNNLDPFTALPTRPVLGHYQAREGGQEATLSTTTHSHTGHPTTHNASAHTGPHLSTPHHTTSKVDPHVLRNISPSLEMLPTDITFEFPQARMSEDMFVEIRIQKESFPTLFTFIIPFTSVCQGVSGINMAKQEPLVNLWLIDKAPIDESRSPATQSKDSEKVETQVERRNLTQRLREREDSDIARLTERGEEIQAKAVAAAAKSVSTMSSTGSWIPKTEEKPNSRHSISVKDLNLISNLGSREVRCGKHVNVRSGEPPSSWK